VKQYGQGQLCPSDSWLLVNALLNLTAVAYMYMHILFATNQKTRT